MDWDGEDIGTLESNAREEVKMSIDDECAEDFDIEKEVNEIIEARKTEIYEEIISSSMRMIDSRSGCIMLEVYILNEV